MSEVDQQPEFGFEAQDKFYALCRDAESRNLGEKIDDTNRGYFLGLLVALAPVFNFPRSVMSGDKDAETEVEKIGLARGYVSSWKYYKLDPYRVIGALKKCPQLFKKYPTEGLIRAVIRGGSLGECEGWLKNEPKKT